jgi:hypothetical protein
MDAKFETWATIHQARFDRLLGIYDQQAIHEGVRFSIKPDFQKELDRGKRVSKKLREAFEEKGIVLYPATTVWVEKKNLSWLLIDNYNQQTYAVRKGKEEETLDIYIRQAFGIKEEGGRLDVYKYPFLKAYPPGEDWQRYEFVIQYWFFYPFNDGPNNHEGDWEHINVRVSTEGRRGGLKTSLQVLHPMLCEKTPVSLTRIHE